MVPGCTGEPWKAPAWYFSSAKAATNLPSRVAPIFTRTVAPEVGPEALKTSSRDITIFTGRLRLDVALVHRRGLELPLDDQVGLLEARLHVAHIDLDPLGDVGRLLGLGLDADREEVIVQQGRVGAPRLH